ncbi:AraC family transcriptional regulator [Novispirillum itersonii]|uniref:AraC-like DNA-binding protein n=1 Tax=Novispirillum itersonii TaxID=189 RepID=A0A7X0DMV5_NOVIT|nr:helix-turn-helix transcriptional regulator [Novispirillum itersonii]MBB6211488.1 AraC-like DNA-binding protein [Novispirillum itersonii]
MSINRQDLFPAGENWQPLSVPDADQRPDPLRVRAQSLPARHYFPDHSHDWHQMVYAITGALTVFLDGRRFVIPPEQAVWLPGGTPHAVATRSGAEYRSLYVAETAGTGLAGVPFVFAVPPLLRALIIEATDLQRADDGSAYAEQVNSLILATLPRLTALPSALPWPRRRQLIVLCEALYAHPDDPRGLDDWAKTLGLSERSLTRHFQAETGMTLRAWRRRLRLFRSQELLATGASITAIALELGYASVSAFIAMFRAETGLSPDAYRRSDLSAEADATR